jgi:hypothetical protein
MQYLLCSDSRHLTTACTRPPTLRLSSTSKGLGRRVMPGVMRYSLCEVIKSGSINIHRLLAT